MEDIMVALGLLQGGIRGYLFPNCGISLSRRLATFSATHSGRVDDMPTVHTTQHFHNPRQKRIIHTTVSLKDHDQTYLIAGFYDRTLEVNKSLRDLDPSVQWRGAIAAFSTGDRVTFHTRPKGPTHQIFEAVCVYMHRVKNALDLDLEVPTLLTSEN
ncbi:hypothetical protein BJ165DRAFT_1410914 [Panaeolus papilionaceus]|nr:hypothetical protein BJ165DRAFT_1410914 [Panaeolus papilionaceus]